MSILAICPYCGEGRVRVPDHALGLSATCPRCQSSFTIIPADPATARAAPAARSAAPSRAAPTPRPATEVAASPLPPAQTAPEPVPSLPPLLPPDIPLTESGGLAVPLGLVAVTLTGLGLFASQLPFGRVSAAVLTGLGLVVGLVALLSMEQKWWVPALASGMNAVVLLVVLVLPGWLGLGPWWRGKPVEDSGTIKAIANDGRSAVPADWVDASAASWQQGDVRVSLTAVNVGFVPLTSTDRQKRWTKEKYLQLWLRVRNAGVARKLDFQGWSATAGPGGAPPRLTDSTGKVLVGKSLDAALDPAARRQPVVLFPGKTADQLLFFEAPPPTVERLRLELPGNAFGGSEPVHFEIPRSFISYRTAP